MEIATAKIKIKDHKEEITKIIDDTYLRPSYNVKKISEGVYEGHAGIIGVMGMTIIRTLDKKIYCLVLIVLLSVKQFAKNMKKRII